LRVVLEHKYHLLLANAGLGVEERRRFAFRWKGFESLLFFGFNLLLGLLLLAFAFFGEVEVRELLLHELVRVELRGSRVES